MAKKFKSDIEVPAITAVSYKILNNANEVVDLPLAPVQSVAGKIGEVLLDVNDIDGLSNVATSGSYNDLINKPILNEDDLFKKIAQATAFRQLQYYDTNTNFPTTGDARYGYIARDTSKGYIWDGTSYEDQGIVEHDNEQQTHWLQFLNSEYCTIGNKDKRIKAIYVDEVHIAAQTLYIDNQVAFQSTADEMQITRNSGQSIRMFVTGSGNIKIESENTVEFFAPSVYLGKSDGTGTVTARSNAVLNKDVTINQNLTVNGDLILANPNKTTRVKTKNATISDNIILLNEGEVGDGVSLGQSGIEIDRGTSALGNSKLVWVESQKKWSVSKVNSDNTAFELKNIALVEDITKSQVGLVNVDNTSDLSKPISTATQSALDLKANKAEVGTLTNLLTQNKNTLVDSVNETYRSLFGIDGIEYTTQVQSDVYVDPNNKSAYFGPISEPAVRANLYVRRADISGNSYLFYYAKFLGGATGYEWTILTNSTGSSLTIPTNTPGTSPILAGTKARISFDSYTYPKEIKFIMTDSDGNIILRTINLDQSTSILNSMKVDKITGKGLSTNDYTAVEKTKLEGIATNATANDTDANLKNRANHTGTQLASTITGLSTVATTGNYNDLSNKPNLTNISPEQVTVNSTTTTDGYTTGSGGIRFNFPGTTSTYAIIQAINQPGVHRLRCFYVFNNGAAVYETDILRFSSANGSFISKFV
jgi:hypothetical protein